jgi:AraC-like DNA-binding protein
LEFDTESVPARDRFQSWAAAHHRVLPLEIRLADRRRFRGQMDAHHLGPIDVVRIKGDASSGHRTRQAIAASDPEGLIVTLPFRGQTALQQHRRSAVAGPSDVMWFESSSPFEVRHDQPFDVLLVQAHASLLGRDFDRLRSRSAVRFPGAVGLGRVASAFISELWTLTDMPVYAASHQDIADGLIAVLRALVLAPPGGVLGTASSVLLPSVLRFIDDNLADPRLGPDAIARAHFLSRRQLDRLFAADGMSVARVIRQRRLERCRRDLQDPACAHMPIAAIATEWGFANQSYFGRLFRETYGCTPKEIRAL